MGLKADSCLADARNTMKRYQRNKSVSEQSNFRDLKYYVIALTKSLSSDYYMASCPGTLMATLIADVYYYQVFKCLNECHYLPLIYFCPHSYFKRPIATIQHVCLVMFLLWPSMITFSCSFSQSLHCLENIVLLQGEGPL